jgi:hypothetical protein
LRSYLTGWRNKVRWLRNLTYQSNLSTFKYEDAYCACA